MKFLVILSLIAVAAAAENEQTRDKRGVLGLGVPALGYGLGYPSLGYAGYAAAPLPVAKVIAPAYHAPIAAAYHAPIAHAPILPAYHAPIAKVIQPYPAIAKIGYSSYSSPILPYGGLGYGLGYGYGGYGLH